MEFSVSNFLDNQSDEAIKTVIRNHLRVPYVITRSFKCEDVRKKILSGKEHLRFDFDSRDDELCDLQNDYILKCARPIIGTYYEYKVRSRKGALSLFKIEHTEKTYSVYEMNGCGTTDIILGIYRGNLGKWPMESFLIKKTPVNVGGALECDLKKEGYTMKPNNSI